MKPFELKSGVWQLPAVDWNVREFHGYAVDKGTTYNAYLTTGSKNTLFDTVKAPFTKDLIGMIKGILDPESIDYIVVNHAEPDHTGALSEIVDLVKPEKIFCSKSCKDALIAHYHKNDWPFEIIGDNQVFDIGGRTVKFIETRMLHWPESCFSYLQEDKILISNDAFGMHWATTGRYDCDVDLDELLAHCAKYYANILMPFSTFAQKLIQKLKSLNLPIDIIAPDHGVMWKDHIPEVLQAYERWSKPVLKKKAVILYDSMWKSTEKMAAEYLQAFSDSGFDAKLLNASLTRRSDVATEILDSAALVFGSPTFNSEILPTMGDQLCYIKGLLRNGSCRVGALFGSYGWSGEAVKIIAEMLKKTGLNFPEEPIKYKYIPDAEVLQQCYEQGLRIAALAEEKVNESLK